HVDEAPAHEAGDASPFVAHSKRSRENAASQVELLRVFGDVGGPEVQPRSIRGSKGEPEPVGTVDEILVDDRLPSDLARKLVVDASDVGAGIAHGSRLLFLGGPARCEHPVPKRAQRLAQTFLLRVEPLVPEYPLIAHRFGSFVLARRSRKSRTSLGSCSE